MTLRSRSHALVVVKDELEAGSVVVVGPDGAVVDLYYLVNDGEPGAGPSALTLDEGAEEPVYELGWYPRAVVPDQVPAALVRFLTDQRYLDARLRAVAVLDRVYYEV